jgi:hypothetical protein
MIVLTPETASLQGFEVRTRPAASATTITTASVDLYFVNEDTNQEIHISPYYVAYNQYGFLTVSASVYLTGSDFYTLRINQMTGSSICQELMRSLVFATNESPVVRQSEPLQSYTGSSESQRLNEYIIWNP